MTDVTLAVSAQGAGDDGSLHYDVLIGDRKVGGAAVYCATEDEVEAFKKKLKKRIKVGEAYTVKIFLEEKYIPNKTDLIEIRDSFLTKYPTCDPSKVLFARTDGGKFVPLTDGSRLEALEIGKS